MAITTVSITDAERDVDGIWKASSQGTVFVTKLGRPEHVVMNITEYQKLTGRLPSLADMLAMPEGVDDFGFDPRPLVSIAKPNREVDLSD